jgi:hypothetical protein
VFSAKKDVTGPTIFVPWVRPANPGGKDWGQGGLIDAAPNAIVRTFVYDITGINTVTLHYQNVETEKKHQITMKGGGAYPSITNPAVIATQYQATLPAGTGNIRYYVEAEDTQGNTSHSPVGRIFIA